MKAQVRASLVQFAPRWLAREENAQRMQSFVERESQEGAELILFPELSNIGYITPSAPGRSPASDTGFVVKYVQASEPIPGPTTDVLTSVCRRRGVYVVAGLAQSHPTIKATLYNSAVLIGPGGIIGIHHKMHIPRNEKLFFYPGDTREVYETELGNIAMTVCYDSRVPELTRILALKGAEIICCSLAGSEASLDIVDNDTFKHRAYIRAQENELYFLACNRSGKEGLVDFLGHSAIAGPTGTILAASDTNKEEVIRATLENDRLLRCRAQMNNFKDRRPELYTLLSEPLSGLRTDSPIISGKRTTGRTAGENRRAKSKY